MGVEVGNLQSRVSSGFEDGAPVGLPDSFGEDILLYLSTENTYDCNPLNAKSLKEEASNFSDPADRATQEEEFALELRTRDRERKLIRKIDKTIVRVDEDDYGFCDACGIEIGLQRLEVRPTAEMCIDCKTTQEIKEKQIASWAMLITAN